MPDDQIPENTLSANDRARRGRIGDVPDTIGRRYYTDDRGGSGLGFYVDATVARAAFRDHGHQLAAERADPNAIRDMTEIAKHRGWLILTAKGSAEFRREAWLAGRQAGLEVRGYQPTERDLQDLERRHVGRERGDLRRERHRDREESRQRRAHGTQEPRREDRRGVDQMRVVEMVVRTRVKDDESQKQILDRARTRIADWLERGANFEASRPDRSGPERQKTR